MEGIKMADKQLPLGERVRQFQCLELPGQSMMMHMGTAYLVGDLWRALQSAHRFIENGIEMGYIHLPDTNDPAIDTLASLRAALAPSGDREGQT